jgi:uncharacterized membrane protein
MKCQRKKDSPFFHKHDYQIFLHLPLRFDKSKVMKKHFLTGLIILLPVAITLALVGSLINFFTHPFVEVVASSLKEAHFADRGFLFLTHDQVVDYLSKLLILVCLFFAIVLLGMLTRWVVIRSFFSLWDKLLHKIPVVNTVYKATQELIKTIFTRDKTGFKRVVMAPYPFKGMYALGLVTGDTPKACSKDGSTLVSVLILTTPNPTSGFLLMYKTEDLIHLELRPEEAIKYILSCGVLTPEEKKLIP